MSRKGRHRLVSEEECEIIFREYLMREEYMGGRLTVFGIHEFYDRKRLNGEAIGGINRILPPVNNMSFNDYFSKMVFDYNQMLVSDDAEKEIGVGVLNLPFEEFIKIYPEYVDGFEFFRRMKNDYSERLEELTKSKNRLLSDVEKMRERRRNVEAEIENLKVVLKETNKKLAEAEERSRNLISRNKREAREKALEFREETKDEKAYELTAKMLDFTEIIKNYTRASLEVIEGGNEDE